MLRNLRNASVQPLEQVSDIPLGMNNSRGTQKPVRVLLVDDSILTLEGLKVVLSNHPTLRVVAVASSESAAVAAVHTHQPNVVVLDVQVSGASGIELCRTIRASHPEIVIFFFTAHDSKDFLREAILAGAQGYLLKSASGEAVAKSIEIVSNGQAIMDQYLTPQVMEWVRERGEGIGHNSPCSLSEEDLLLLSHVASGKTNRGIAQELKVSPGKITTRLQRIYRRLKVSRRTEAARYFVELGLGASHDSDSGVKGKRLFPDPPVREPKYD